MRRSQKAIPYNRDEPPCGEANKHEAWYEVSYEGAHFVHLFPERIVPSTELSALRHYYHWT